VVSTNFFWHATDHDVACPTCGHTAEPQRLHIGKSSGGWVFALRIHPDLGISSLDDWKRVWSSGGVIRDEYGETLTPAEMLSRIVDRAPKEPIVRTYGGNKPFGYGYSSEEEMLRANCAVLHPSGLLRADPSRREHQGRHRVRHGEGTWDYHEGSFS
jgi:hypothetical protein